MNESLPRAILLDFYGTVVEEDDVPIGDICSWISQVSPLGVTADEIGSYWGDVFHQLCIRSHGATFQLQRELELISLRNILRYFEADLDADELSQVLFDYWMHPPMFPESKEVLDQCRLPICVISNIDNADLLSALEYHNLQFHWLVTSEDCKAYKPRVEIFQKALTIIGMSSSEVVHVGDSFRSDVLGAKELGIPVLWVNRKRKTIPREDIVPDYICTDLSGLLSIIGK